MAFHEVQFPPSISLGASGGPERRTEVVTVGSGGEERNQQWANSRRRYDAGYGAKSLDDIHTIIGFFEERRGRFHGFRWKDWTDFKSVPPRSSTSSSDQVIGTGDGVETDFQLVKVYGNAFAPWTRTITKPVAGTVKIAVDGVDQSEGSDFTVNTETGIVSFNTAPADTLVITAGFEFDVPVRFDTDTLTINVASFLHGEIPNIPIVELLT